MKQNIAIPTLQLAAAAFFITTSQAAVIPNDHPSNAITESKRNDFTVARNFLPAKDANNDLNTVDGDQSVDFELHSEMVSGGFGSAKRGEDEDKEKDPDHRPLTGG